MHLKRVPSQGLDNMDVVVRVCNGERMRLPQDIDPVCRDIMVACWHQDPLQRPTMTDVHARLVAYVNHLKSAKHQQPRLMRQSSADTVTSAATGTATSLDSSASSGQKPVSQTPTTPSPGGVPTAAAPPSGPVVASRPVRDTTPAGAFTGDKPSSHYQDLRAGSNPRVPTPVSAPAPAPGAPLTSGGLLTSARSFPPTSGGLLSSARSFMSPPANTDHVATAVFFAGVTPPSCVPTSAAPNPSPLARARAPEVRPVSADTAPAAPAARVTLPAGLVPMQVSPLGRGGTRVLPPAGVVPTPMPTHRSPIHVSPATSSAYADTLGASPAPTRHASIATGATTSGSGGVVLKRVQSDPGSGGAFDVEPPPRDMESYSDGIYSDLAGPAVVSGGGSDSGTGNGNGDGGIVAATGRVPPPLRSHNSSPADVRDETRVVVDKDGGVSRTRRRGDSNPRTPTHVFPAGAPRQRSGGSGSSTGSVPTARR